MSRTFLIGDVHGCTSELHSLVSELSPVTGDRFGFVGDLVDKGPDSVGTVKLVRELLSRFPGSFSVSGNHEERSTRERSKKGYIPDHLTGLSESDWSFLDGLPLLVRLPSHGVLVVHGGIYPKFLQDYPGIGEVPEVWKRGGGKRMQRMQRFLRVRYVDLVGNMVTLGSESPESRHWSDTYNGSEGFVVYGHEPFYDGPRVRDTSLGLDTGCVFGGRLTSLVLSDGQRGPDGILVSVPGRVYSDRLKIEE